MGNFNIWLRIALAIIGLLGLVVLFERDIYLPFLADTAIPTSLLPITKHDQSEHDTIITIEKLPPKAKVVYWAAEPKDPRGITIHGAKEAYGDYINAGVILSNEQGVAYIPIKCPQAYKVTHFYLFESILPPHIHYRYELPGTKGMLSEVFTIEVACSKSVPLD
jgi:hypothetical protein